MNTLRTLLRFALCVALSVACAFPPEARAFSFSPAVGIECKIEAGGGVKVHEPEDAFGNLVFQSGTTDNAYRYCGEQFDADLGLYYLRARYLNTDSGRFWSMDSFEGGRGDPVSLHKYLYANADPVMYSDPSGYQSILMASLTNYAIKTLSYMAVAAPPIAAGARAISRIDMARVAQFLRTVQSSAQAYGSRISELTARAGQIYPKLADKFEEHHFMPKQLVQRLLERGIQVPPALANATVKLDAAYHRFVTNAILERFPRGAKVFDKVKPTLDDVLRELEKIYDDLPLP